MVLVQSNLRAALRRRSEKAFLWLAACDRPRGPVADAR